MFFMIWTTSQLLFNHTKPCNFLIYPNFSASSLIHILSAFTEKIFTYFLSSWQENSYKVSPQFFNYSFKTAAPLEHDFLATVSLAVVSKFI